MATKEGLAAVMGALLQAHGMRVTPERAGRLAAALAPLLDASARDQAEELPDFVAVLEAERWRG